MKPGTRDHLVILDFECIKCSGGWKYRTTNYKEIEPDIDLGKDSPLPNVAADIEALITVNEAQFGKDCVDMIVISPATAAKLFIEKILLPINFYLSDVCERKPSFFHRNRTSNYALKLHNIKINERGPFEIMIFDTTVMGSLDAFMVNKKPLETKTISA